MNWLKIQYPAGAGGKILMYCLSTSKNVVDLGIKNDPVEFTKNNFPNQHGILPIESKGYPYDLSWFSRQYPFTRGHHLSQNEVDQYIEKDSILIEAKKLFSAHYSMDFFTLAMLLGTK